MKLWYIDKLSFTSYTLDFSAYVRPWRVHYTTYKIISTCIERATRFGLHVIRKFVNIQALMWLALLMRYSIRDSDLQGVTNPSAAPIPAQLGYSSSFRKNRSHDQYSYAAMNVALVLALPFSKSVRPGNEVTISICQTPSFALLSHGPFVSVFAL